jgi:hypothetical protein
MSSLGTQPKRDLRTRDAIIFLGGLGGGEGSPTAAGQISTLITSELTRINANGGSVFRVSKRERSEVMGASQFTIYERRKGPLMDIYDIEYKPMLTSELAVHNPILRALWLIVALSSMILRFPLLLRPRRRSKPLRELAQAYYALTILLLVTLYSLTVVLAVIDLFWTRAVGHPTKISSAQAVVVLASGLGLFTPAYRQMLSAAAIDWAAGAIYILPSPVRARLVSHVRSVITAVAGRPETRRVHVVGYSFGTLIALDVIFPKVPTRAMEVGVDRLVTIGCLYDFLRLFAPRYFDQRVTGKLNRWVNIFVPSDILGSNFRRDNGIGPADFQIAQMSPHNVVHSPEESLAAFSIIRLSAFRAHETYWGEEGEPNCFAAVLEELQR